MLVYHELLPPRDEPLARFESWLARKIDAISNSEVHTPVEQFATWHHLRRIRQLTAAGRPTESSVRASTDP
jgi:hypothetical protein